VIAIDGKTVRGAKDKDGKAPHLVAALAHGDRMSDFAGSLAQRPAREAAPARARGRAHRAAADMADA
jgi:hypothetical protein